MARLQWELDDISRVKKKEKEKAQRELGELPLSVIASARPPADAEALPS